MLYYQFSYFCKRLFININSLHLVSSNVTNNMSSIVQKGIGIAILMVAYFEVRVLMYLTLLKSIAESYYLYLSAVFAFPPRSYVIAMRVVAMLAMLLVPNNSTFKPINWKFSTFRGVKVITFCHRHNYSKLILANGGCVSYHLSALCFICSCKSSQNWIFIGEYIKLYTLYISTTWKRYMFIVVNFLTSMWLAD